MKNHALEASVPWSKVAILGMVIPPFNRNPYNGYINPHYWVDGHPLLYRNNGSLDPGTSVFLPSSDKKIWSHLTHLNPSSRRLIFRLVQQQLQRLGLIKDFLGCLPPPPYCENSITYADPQPMESCFHPTCPENMARKTCQSDCEVEQVVTNLFHFDGWLTTTLVAGYPRNQEITNRTHEKTNP